ncbi:MAG: TonB-dependent receptor plug domain-containing protein, partial [Gammaproteobacteria bacterium]|nr:TonB-dependent receptor plug domain-containing protein [Gammaproteobacteria bacterium]
MPPGAFCLVCALLLAAPAAGAQQRVDDGSTGHAGLLEEVVTTATKKSDAQAAQDVPVAMSVINGENLAERQATDIEDLSYALPNVAFDGIGTGKGIANFSIRGLGVAGSIPSIDPTVGVFVDGVYLGVNYGVIAAMMDLEGLEVLRGAQGWGLGRHVQCAAGL